MTKFKLMRKLKPLAIGKEAGACLAASAGLLLLLSDGSGDGTPTPPEPPGPWSPKWAIGDMLKSHTIDATWIVHQINYDNQQYYCEFSFAGSTQFIWIDAVALEDPSIYKVV